MPTPAVIKSILDWYEALPETPTRARESDHQAAQWFLDRGITFQHILAALLLASARRLRRDPDLPPLLPICSLSYFAPIVREVLAEGGLDPGYMTYLHKVVFGVLPEPNPAPDIPPKPPQAPLLTPTSVGGRKSEG